MNLINNQETLLGFIRENLIGDRNLSVRGVALLCDVAETLILNNASFNSQKLAQKLTDYGYDAANLSNNGFNSQATWLTLEYFAYESKVKAKGAKQLARTFGQLGIMTTFDKLKEVSVEAKPLKPIRDTVDWVNCSIYISTLEDPILKSLLTQSLYEDLGTFMYK